MRNLLLLVLLTYPLNGAANGQALDVLGGELFVGDDLVYKLTGDEAQLISDGNVNFSLGSSVGPFHQAMSVFFTAYQLPTHGYVDFQVFDDHAMLLRNYRDLPRHDSDFYLDLQPLPSVTTEQELTAGVHRFQFEAFDHYGSGVLVINTEVPEPSGWVLLVLGIAGLVAWRLR